MITQSDPTPNQPTETVQEAYAALVLAVRANGEILRAATAIRYEAPPGFVAAKPSGGVRNPTLDIVTDPRRLGVSDEITRTAADLRKAATIINQHTSALHTAVARWEGREDTNQ